MVLKPDIDPMGLAISDFFRNKKASKLIVNSSITEDEEMPVDYLFRSYENMPELEQIALQKCQGKVLDVGAAAGCHSLYLQKQNLQVSAIDISELSVQVMKERGVKKVMNVDFFDLKDVKFDTILLLMNGVGIAGNTDGLNKLLQHSKKLLNSGGQVLLDSSDIIYMYEEDEAMEMGYYYGELEYQMQYLKTKSEIFEWLFIDFANLEAKAKQFGFNCELVFEGEHYDYLAKLTLCEK